MKNITSNYSNAKVIVSGYYPLVSKGSNLLLLGLLLIAVGIIVAGPLGGLGGIVLDIAAKDAMVRRSQIFASESAKKFRQVVDEVNAHPVSSASNVSLAIAHFATENSIFASDPWIFGINPDLSPQDSVAGIRGIECDRAGPSLTDMTTCKIASIGHPNSKGVKEYSRVIISLV